VTDASDAGTSRDGEEPTCEAPDVSSRNLAERTGLVGSSAAMRRLRAEVAQYARPGAGALVLGESGTGKELVARALHALSPRAARPFVAVNVAAFGDAVLASELFGHERGAFTGAYARHRGVFEQAHGGTLFLDEVGEMPPAAQAALLRAIEAREVRAVGAERARAVDVRVVAATHRDLPELVRRGAFRADLFHRLAVLVVRVPPLRERVEDLPELVRHLLARLAPEVGPRAPDAAFLRALAMRPWPGNVRELHNALYRAALRSDGRLLACAGLEPDDGEAAPRRPVPYGVAEPLAAVLADERWNLTQAARRLGIARSTLRARIRREGVARGA